MAEKTPLIDVIVPVYNVERYLPACVDSLLEQDFSDYAVTLVDDGSTDGSAALCDGYAAAHPGRVRVYHRENAGPSAARNFAVERSEAAYISFVDADDHVAAEYLSALYAAAAEFDAPMAVSALCREHVLPDGGVRRVTAPVMARGALDRDTALAEVCFEQHFGSFVWGRLVRRDILLAAPMPPGKIFEDTAAVWRQIMACDRVAYVPEALYFYRQREGSLQRRRFEPQHLDFIPAVEDMMAQFQAAGLPDAVLAAGSYKVCRACYVTAYHAADLPPGRYRDVCAPLLPLLRRHYPAAAATGRMEPKLRALCRLLLASRSLFYTAVRLTRR